MVWCGDREKGWVMWCGETEKAWVMWCDVETRIRGG